VQRAGTSWWFGLLTQHSRIDAPHERSKELHYFDAFWRSRFDERSRTRYASYFPRPPGHLAGEWTPRYMHDGWTPSLLAAAAPDTRILVILRDPVDRYLSGLTFALTRGASLNPIVASDAFTRGLYCDQLGRLLRLFDRTQILVLQFERCISAPQEQLSRTLAFLGVEDQKVDARPTQVNASYRRKPALPKPELDRLARAYEDDVLGLRRSFPDIDLALWKNFSHLASPVAARGRQVES